MARISTYVSDSDISPNDKWIGSDANNGFVTKNFTAHGVAYYLNRYNEIGVGSQLNFEYVVDLTDGVLPGKMAIGDGWVDDILISTVTEIKFNALTIDGKVIVDYLEYLVGEEVILFNTSDRNNFGHFKFVSLHEESPNVYVGTFQLRAANGVFHDNGIYGLGLFLKGTKDKYYKHVQNLSSSVWTIKHNLAKLPSVTVKDSAGSTVIGDVNYIDIDTLTITFSGSFSGEAYLN